MDNTCTFENCLKCTLENCWTGQIARNQGIEAYTEHLAMLDEAEALLDDF